MTAETLKPFIPPSTTGQLHAYETATVDREIKRKSKSSTFCTKQIIPIILSIINFLLAAILLAFMVYHTYRISKLELEINKLREIDEDLKMLTKVVQSTRQRLGLDHWDSINTFNTEYGNTLIDEPMNGFIDSKEIDKKENKDDKNNDDNDDDDDEEDDDVDDGDINLHEDDDEYYNYDDEKNMSYDDMVKNYASMEIDTTGNSDENSNSSMSEGDDDLYKDFENYKDSKNKERKTRSIKEPTNEQTEQNEHETINTENTQTSRHKYDLKSLENKGRFVSDTSYDVRQRKPFLHKRNIRRRKNHISRHAKSISSNYHQLPTIRPAAHFHLNHKLPNRHAAIKMDDYNGDIYIGHPSWSNEIDSQDYFQIEHGVLKVREEGLYYVYAQICYNNTHDQNGFVIFHEHKPFLQCLNTVPTNMPLKIHTCHTSGLIYLKENETIHLRDFHSDRNAVLKESNNRSFFGLIRV